MSESNHAVQEIACQPVAIGAIGGSGTRVVANILSELGYFIGKELNHAKDNSSFARKFKRREIFEVRDDEFLRLVQLFVDEMEEGRAEVGADCWGWKEPNTHIVIDRLFGAIPALKYIHVIRNGLDMAHSANQNQPRLWGSHFLGGDPLKAISPRYSLKYWCAVQRHIIHMASDEAIKERFILLNYDDLCQYPAKVIENILAFLNVEIMVSEKRRLVESVVPPASIGRWREAGLAVFDADDVDYVASLGFDV